MDWFATLTAAAIVGLLCIAAWTDLATRTIPDSVAIAAALVGLLSRGLAGVPAVALSIGIGIGLFLLLALLCLRGLLGGGDVKLVAATALGLSPLATWQFLTATALFGGVLAVLHLLLRHSFRGDPLRRPPPRGSALLRRLLAAERWRIARRGPLPYGIAIACGGIWAVLGGPGG